MRARDTFLASIPAFAMLLLGVAAPASARLWQPTPQQQTADYLNITHNKAGETIAISWTASPLVSAPTMKPVLDKYVVLSIAHIHRTPDGTTLWDDVQGVQVRDGAGQALKEVPSDQVSPVLVGVIASAEAITRQASQGKSKVYWSVWEAGAVNACQRGKLVVSYNGENYSFDTPIPGCP